jgi:hypothetical protein
MIVCQIGFVRGRGACLGYSGLGVINLEAHVNSFYPCTWLARTAMALASLYSVVAIIQESL